MFESRGSIKYNPMTFNGNSAPVALPSQPLITGFRQPTDRVGKGH